MAKFVELLGKDPFRVFFPLGSLCALIGVLFWPLKIYEIGPFSEASSRVHVFIQIYGFMLAFVIGFLTTAFPKLTRTAHLSAVELFILLFDYAILVYFCFVENYLAVNLMFLLLLSSLLVMMGRRFVKRQNNPPATFVFMPLAMLSAIVGSIINVVNALQWWHPGASLLEFANALLYQAFILFLLLAVGGFLIKSILGWAPGLPESSADSDVKLAFGDQKSNVHLWIGLGLVGSFIIEAMWHSFAGLLLRAILVSVEVLWQLKLYKFPNSKKLTSTSLFISMWFLVIGCWVVALAPVEYRVDLSHLTLMGGFGLAVFSVATRVIFSHCGYGELLKTSYWPFTVAMTLMILGLATRIVAVVIPDSYYDHLSYAGLSWVLGLLVWVGAVLLKCRHVE